MSQVWKVGSRWSENGNKASSILDIFRRYNVVFVGTFQERFQKIAVGDLLAISDGLKVVAMGQATTLAKPITELDIEFSEADLHRFEYSPEVLGCRVAFMDLSPIEQPSYRIGAFHGVNERAEEFREIFRVNRQRFEDQRQFEIKAKSCTLLHNVGAPADVLWQQNLTFEVPIYQRPYSWGAPQIQRLVSDLLDAFRGMNGRPVEEPMFIGTMQLTEKKLCDGISGLQMQEVIDGQQRMSTLILLLKALQDRSSANPIWKDLDIGNRLETRVNSGTQQKFLEEALASQTDERSNSMQNPYLQAMPIILKILDDDNVSDDENVAENPRKQPQDIGRFVEYLISKVYFVVIETRATLSKTLQIFDAINTSGMDLNGGDVFKVRYYEYLRLQKKMNESAFESISKLYSQIDEKNLGHKRKVCSIEDILSLVRHIHVARYKMPKVLHDFSASVYFDRLFDTVQSINVWDNFSPACKNVDVSLEELERLIKARFNWEAEIPILSTESRMMLELMRWSRYGKYNYLIVLFRDRFKADSTLTEKFVIQLSKLLIVYSILFKKMVYELHSFFHDLQEKMLDEVNLKSAAEVIANISQRIADKKSIFENALNTYEIAYNPKAKNLICRLSAIREEIDAGEHSTDQLFKLIFMTDIDIEHIESANHQNEGMRAALQKEWDIELNGLGNLIILECSVNRSIKNGDYQSIKINEYVKSSFRIVKEHARNYDLWSLENCKKRKVSEANKLVGYIFSAD